MKRLKKLWLILAVAVSLVAIALCLPACADRDDIGTVNTEYTITLKLNADQNWETVTGAAGSSVEYTRPNPSRPNTVFDGWSLTPDGAVVELPTVMPEGDVVYYAVFSRYYNITLNAGYGTLSGDDRINAKVSQNLYDIVKDVVPQAPGNSTFDGWYYGNVKIDASSTETMPASGITLEAKYTIDYTITFYLETGYKSGEYEKATAEAGKPDKKTGVGFIGDSPLGSEYNTYAGYELGNTSSFVLSAAGGNDFDAYYTLRGYNLVFNANVPEEGLSPSGSMGIEIWGYGEENELPECKFGITGYRFSYWSTNPEGTVRLGDTHSIAGNDTVYAVWAKGYTDIYGMSSDYIFVDTDADGNTVAYLKRLYNSQEIVGEYNAATKIVTFKNAKNEIIVRGKLDDSDHSFAYFGTTAYALHAIGYADEDGGFTGAVKNDVTIALADNGTAVYKNGNNNISGTYSFDAAEQSMKFTASGTEFYFRLVTFQNADGSLSEVFEIRSEIEIGTWQRMRPNGETSEYFSMSLNGYGEATMTAISRIAQNPIVTTGNYRFLTASTDEKPDLMAVFITSGGSEMIRFTIIDNSATATEDDKYTKFYKEWQFGTTVYAKPAEGASMNTDTAAKFVLDGYGIYSDSATFTQGGNTTKGKYVVDLDARTIAFGNTEYFLDIYTEGEGDDAVSYYVYEQKQPGKSELNGFYAISGLESVFKPGMVYYFRFFNDGVARLYVDMPQVNETFGSVYLEMTPIIVGSYQSTGASSEYLFKATITDEQIAIVAAYYSSLYDGYALDLSNFGDFKFRFAGIDENGFQSGEVTALGDGYVGYSLVENGVTYVTDGYGKAVATNSETGQTVSRDYSVNMTLGIPFIVMNWTVTRPGDGGQTVTEPRTQLYTLIAGEFRAYIGEYGKYNTQYSSAVADTTFRLIVYAGDYGVLAYENLRTNAIVAYSYGKITWTDETKKFGKYSELATLNDSAATLVSRFGDFRFGFKTVKAMQNGNEVEVDRIFIYDANPTEVTDGKFVINGENGATLTLDINNVTAEYSEPDADAEGGAVKFTGEFKFSEDVVVILSDSETEDGQSVVVGKAFKLVRNGETITSFKTASVEAGTWQNVLDSRSTLSLTGVVNGDGVCGGTYYEYDEETEQVVAHSGTYARTTIGDYIFTMDETVEQEDENGDIQQVHPSFRFIVSYDAATRFPLFRIYTVEVNMPIYNSVSGGSQVGLLSGGGYSDLVYQSMSGQAVGQLMVYPNAPLFIDGAMLCAFADMSGNPLLFFARVSTGESLRGVLLDGVYSNLNFGIFYNNDDAVVTVPVNDGEGNYTDDEFEFDYIWFNGMGLAMLVAPAEEGETPVVYTAAYMAYSSSTYVLYTFVDDDPYIIGQFRLYNSSQVTPERPYTIRFADNDLVNTHKSNKGELFITDGFAAAVYVDNKGVAYSGAFTAVEGQPGVLRIQYLYGLSVITIYVEVDSENATFTVLSMDDPRIPQA